MRVLALDITGTPRQWISSQDAIIYASKRAIAWSLGEIAVRYRGGIQRDGTASYLETHSIIAISGNGFNPNNPRNVVLNNRALFGRDRYTCGYCGKLFDNYYHLSRDHIVPVSRGGANTWMNCISACRTCNSYKGCKLLSECGLELLYLPYVPSHAENMILQGRNILADQMSYLSQLVPKHSRLRI